MKKANFYRGDEIGRGIPMESKLKSGSVARRMKNPEDKNLPNPQSYRNVNGREVVES
jgi:hypothetical protein